jgi:hypothetical protein
MTDYDDRGAYTPPADRLAFDPRQPVRGGGPAPVTLIVSGLALVAVVGGVFFLYRDGFKHRGDGPTLVGAPVADVRTPTASEASGAAPAGLVVDRTTAPPPAPAFAPTPSEEPLPRSAPLAPAPAAAPVVAAAPGPAPIHATPPSAAATAVARATPAPASAPQAVAVTPQVPPKPRLAAAAVPAARPAAASITVHSAAKHAAPVTIAALTDDATGHRLPTHAAPAAAAVAPAPKPRPAAAMALAPKPAVAAAAGPAHGWVQIGAFSSSDLADQGWRDVARLKPDAMGGKGKAVQPLERDGKTLYRTYVTGFASVTGAQAFCAELQASGKSCMVK